MKKLVGILTFILFSIFQLHAQEWQTDFDTAKQLASQKDEPIVLVFQGSDWCAPCIKLDREIWSSDEFKNYSKEHFVMLQADFPRKKANALPDAQQEKNNKLAEKYNTQGYFPFVVVLDKKGNVLGETGYVKTSPLEYINQLNAFLN